MDNINVTIDSSILQEKAKEFALKGALKAIEDYYTGYDSPYKKAIKENLTNKSIDSLGINLPDILGLINEHLTIEIDKIANTAVAKTFVPLVVKFLTRQEKEANFSDILKEFIETAGYDDKHADDFSVSIDKHYQHGWLSIEISDAKRNYKFTLHEDYDTKNTANPKYKLLGLPYTDKTDRNVMKVQIDNATLELPFTKDILKDSFVSHLAGYIISDTIITMDIQYFTDDMFPETCHCH